jgi:site-specific recombinase XerD
MTTGTAPRPQGPQEAGSEITRAVTLAPVPGDGAARALIGHQELLDLAEAFARAAKSPATRRAYASDLRDFDAWCRGRGLASLPAEPDTVALYVSDLARRGYAVATITRRLAAISQVHQLRAGLDDPPTAAWRVRQVVQGIRREHGVAPVQKDALLTVQLRRLVAGCDPGTAAGARDRALLLLGFGAALRRSELCALDVDDVTESGDGLLVRIRRSKTDPEGEGHAVGVVKGQHPEIDPVRALQAWRAKGGIQEGPLFRPVSRADHALPRRLTPQSVARVVKRAAQRAGLSASECQRLAGHSLRAGHATQAAASGAPERAIARQGRWRSTATLRRYIRAGDVWQENASAWLGL